MQEQNYFDLPSKEKEGVVQALQSLLDKLEGDDSEEPLMVVQKCADANFAPLPTQYQGVLDKMLAKGSNKKVLGAAQNTFAWDAGGTESRARRRTGCLVATSPIPYVRWFLI